MMQRPALLAVRMAFRANNSKRKSEFWATAPSWGGAVGLCGQYPTARFDKGRLGHGRRMFNSWASRESRWRECYGKRAQPVNDPGHLFEGHMGWV